LPVPFFQAYCFEKIFKRLQECRTPMEKLPFFMPRAGNSRSGAMNEVTSRKVFVAGANNLQNELIASTLSKETGLPCISVEDLSRIKTFLAKDEKSPCLALYDCLGKDRRTFLSDLKQNGAERDLMVGLFNLKKSEGLEKEAFACGARGFFYRGEPFSLLVKATRCPVPCGHFSDPQEEEVESHPPALLIFFTAAVVAFFLPPVYRSTSTILIEEQEIPAEFVRATVTSYAEERIQMIKQRVMSFSRLNELVNRFNLYPELRASWTTEQIVAKMRDDIRVEPVSAEVKDPRTGRATSATIAFTLAYEGKTRKPCFRWPTPSPPFSSRKTSRSGNARPWRPPSSWKWR
jgi:hypothetical protein